MNTRNWLPPLYEAEVLKVFRHPMNDHLAHLFQGPYYNRRRPSSQVKPRIRKLIGAEFWVCMHRPSGPHGFGVTPGEAYASWKSKQC